MEELRFTCAYCGKLEIAQEATYERHTLSSGLDPHIHHIMVTELKGGRHFGGSGEVVRWGRPWMPNHNYDDKPDVEVVFNEHIVLQYPGVTPTIWSRQFRTLHVLSWRWRLRATHRLRSKTSPGSSPKQEQVLRSKPMSNISIRNISDDDLPFRAWDAKIQCLAYRHLRGSHPPHSRGNDP